MYGSNFSSPDETKVAIANGYQLICLGNDFKAIREVFTDRLAWFDG